MKIISLGAGVQSTTLYLMSCAGEMERADLAIFADTGWEPKAVYEHLERLKAIGDIPIEIVTAGNLREDAIVGENTTGHKFAAMPYFIKNPAGEVNMMRRQCTGEYKIKPLRKRMRELGATAKNPFKMWIGISVDEAHRMKPSGVKYYHCEWPLIDQRMSRADCRYYLEVLGWEVAKSACLGCPFRDDSSWSRMKSETPEEFADAVEFDHANRRLKPEFDETFLHRSGVPLDEAVFKDENQIDLFGNECEGMCGV